MAGGTLSCDPAPSPPPAILPNSVQAGTIWRGVRLPARSIERSGPMLRMLASWAARRAAGFVALLYIAGVLMPSAALAFADGAVSAYCFDEIAEQVASAQVHVHVHSDGTVHHHPDKSVRRPWDEHATAPKADRSFSEPFPRRELLRIVRVHRGVAGPGRCHRGPGRLPYPAADPDQLPGRLRPRPNRSSPHRPPADVMPRRLSAAGALTSARGFSCSFMIVRPRLPWRGCWPPLGCGSAAGSTIRCGRRAGARAHGARRGLDRRLAGLRLQDPVARRRHGYGFRHRRRCLESRRAGDPHARAGGRGACQGRSAAAPPADGAGRRPDRVAEQSRSAGRL